MRPRHDFAHIEPPSTTVGGAEAVVDESDDHSPHTFLYVPDLSAQTGWSGHRVPEWQERRERGQVGFRHRWGKE